MRRLRYGLAMANHNVPSPMINEFSKRGGSGTNALTNTQDPSLYPTSPPDSKFVAGVPKIDGSEGGFIGLIVGIGVLVLLCCCLVFYLLHTRPHGGRSGNINHPFTTASTTTPPTGLFASRRKRSKGWMQQSHEFDYDSGEDEALAGKNGAATYGDGGSGYAGPPIYVKFKTLSSPPAPSRGVNTDAYTDPFDPDRLPDSVRTQQAPLSPIAREPKQTSYNTTEGSPKESPPTSSFKNGTKFVEQF